MTFHSKMFGWQYVWLDFADEMGVKQKDEGASSDEAITEVSVKVPGKPWQLTFYPYVNHGKKRTSGTTVVLPFQGADQFVFSVFHQKGGWSLGKLFGLQDIEIGDAEFDGKFIVQASQKFKVVELFGDLTLRDQLLAQEGALELKIVADAKSVSPEWPVPSDHRVLLYTQDTIIDDFTRLKSVYSLMIGVLERIRAVGAKKRPDELTIPPRALRSVFLK